MKTFEEVLALLDAAEERAAFEHYITEAWVKPVQRQKTWYFEEIDIARLRLVHQLHRELSVNDEGIGVVLSLLDQLYALRARLRIMAQAAPAQPDSVRAEILALLGEVEG